MTRPNYKLDTDAVVRFYEQEFYVLSNFSAFRVKIGTLDFDTAEHAYLYVKFPGREEIRREILAARSAHEAFKIAERNKQFVRDDWGSIRISVMREILWAKVNQHVYVCRKLLETGERQLIEDSWRDDFWGWGPTEQGQNQLGKLWMEIRADLQKQAVKVTEQDL